MAYSQTEVALNNGRHFLDIVNVMQVVISDFELCRYFIKAIKKKKRDTA